MSKSGIRYVIVALTLGLIGSLTYSAYLSYLLVDRSLTKAYTDMSFERDLALQRLATILENEWKDWPQEQIMDALSKVAERMPDNDRSLPFVDEDLHLVVFGTVEFKVENGRLARIIVPLEDPKKDGLR